MTTFFQGLKNLFEKIPAKTNFLKDLGFGGSYIGFRYFLQGHNEKPSDTFMKGLSDKLGYDYVSIPIKRDGSNQELIDLVEDEFTNDVKIYLSRFKNDPARTYSSNLNKEKSLSETLNDAFEEDIFHSKTQIDLSDIFE